jgi:hypothetical protein
VDHILHAGDIGDPAILAELEKVAAVTAIRGNVDKMLSLRPLPETDAVELGGKTFYLIHNVKDLDLNPQRGGFAAVVSGHSHKAAIEWRDGVLFFNPGSAGPRRFSLPISVGMIELEGGMLRARVVELDCV